jgi:hypothetical protein
MDLLRLWLKLISARALQSLQKPTKVNEADHESFQRFVKSEIQMRKYLLDLKYEPS